MQGEDLLVTCYYIDCGMNAYAISPAQLYSNTPSDFDFKLESLAQGFQSLSDFAQHLAANVDIVFPVIHGKFGEDGGIQELLEKANVPFVGTPSKNCLLAFDKYNASLELNAQGFLTVPNFLVEKDKLAKSELEEWFQSINLDKENGKVVVKPTSAGSSIGVVVAYGANDAAEKAEGIISEGIDDKVIIEVFLEGGTEFTAIVVDVGTANNSEPVVLLPTEVELQSSSNIDIQEDTIFNYRRKYLPTRQVAYHTPPRFPSEVIDCIRQGVSILFRCLGLRDFARIDGWFLPTPVTSLPSAENTGKFGNTKYGAVLFTDINLMTGMEQTSFLFQQSSKLDVTPCLLTSGNGYSSFHNQNMNGISRDVWTLPYSLVLRHTIEEVNAACIEAIDPERMELTSRLRDQVMNELGQSLSKYDWFAGFDIADKQPIKYSLQQWINHVKEAQAVCMVVLEKMVLFNRCWDLQEFLTQLASYGVHTIPKDLRATEEILKSSPDDIWNDLKAKLQTETDLEVYANALERKLQRMPANCLSRAHGVIEMPVSPPESLIFEPFIETDEIIISTKSVDDSTRHLVWKGENKWLEVTVGVVGKRGEMLSLNPSITVKESGDILSLEEKFQGK
uniref:ATP-grasp domain-containing protein n=1 Tax=Oryza meridionalis TaxID=40149 RepID=A0A0E0EWX1_9ORYZ